MIHLNLELADTQIKRSHGLMDRKSLDENHGMIFIFPRKNEQSFWMQNTYIPLDIAFLDDSGKIFQISSMYPLNTRFVTSLKPCKYAIEVNAGWFSKNNIKVGFQMFNGNDWVKELKSNLSSYSHSARFTKVAIMEEDENNELEGELTPEQEQIFDEENPGWRELTNQYEQQLPTEDQYSMPENPNQVVEQNMDQLSKIKQADIRKDPMSIVYWTLSGIVLPPRRIQPLEGEGYPIKSGPNGRRFTGYDSSPTITGDGWEIAGGTPKSFLIDNIINLEILSDKGEVTPEKEQTIEEPQNLWDRIKNKIFNR